MIDHLGINCADLEAAKAFYDAVLAPLGFTRQMDFGVAVGYGTADKPDFWIGTFDGVGANRETHIAFTAADAGRVRAFYDAAMATRGRVAARAAPAPRVSRSVLRRVRA